MTRRQMFQERFTTSFMDMCPSCQITFLGRVSGGPGGSGGELLNQKKEYGGVISLGPFVFLFLHRETGPRNSEHVSREDGRGHVTLKLWLVHAPTVRHTCVSDPGTQTRSHIQIHMVPVPPGQQETLGRPLHLLLLHSLGGGGL